MDASRTTAAMSNARPPAAAAQMRITVRFWVTKPLKPPAAGWVGWVGVASAATVISRYSCIEPSSASYI